MITILVPCLNEGKYIDTCRCSILAFDIPEGQKIEILVLDGQSTDDTREQIQHVAAGESPLANFVRLPYFNLHNQ